MVLSMVKVLRSLGGHKATTSLRISSYPILPPLFHLWLGGPGSQPLEEIRYRALLSCPFPFLVDDFHTGCGKADPHRTKDRLERQAQDQRNGNL